MPTSTTHRRVAKRSATPQQRKAALASIAKAASVAKPRKRSRAARKSVKPASDSNTIFLIAQFAEALGQVPSRAPRKRRSLAAALAGAGDDGASAIDAMAGVRLPGAAPRDRHLDEVARSAPYAEASRRHRAQRLLDSAGAWCVMVAVTAAIVGTAAAGFMAQAPQAARTIATASATQF